MYNSPFYQNFKTAKFLLFLALAVSFIPAFAFAQATSPINFAGFVEIVINLIRLATPVVAGLALLAFFWGAGLFILNAGNVEKRQTGRQVLIWGVVALFVMVSIWGILLLLTGDIGGTFGIPHLPT